MNTTQLTQDNYAVQDGDDVVLFNTKNRRWYFTTQEGLTAYAKALVSPNATVNEDVRDFLADLTSSLETPMVSKKSGRGCAVFMTSGCNMRCIHCRYACTTGRSPLSIAVIRQYLENEHARGATQVTFTGGEPTMVWPLLMEAIEAAKALGMVTVVLTNGSLISENRARQLADAGTNVQVSLDAVNPDLFMRFRGLPIGATLGGIEALVSAGVKVSLSCTLNGLTIGRIDEVIDYALSHGIKGLHFPFLEKGGRAASSWSELTISDEEIISFFERLATRYFQGGLRSKIILEDFEMIMAQLAEPSSADHCNMSCAISALNEDGRVYGCTNVCGDERFQFGHVTESPTQLIAAERLLHKSLPRAADIDKCRDCEFSWACLGGCRDRVMRANDGRVDAPDPYCNVLKWLYQRLLIETARLVEQSDKIA